MLRSTRFGNESKQLLTAALLDKLHAVPVRARITYDETGKCFVDGRPLNLETATRLRQGAISIRQNFARKIVGEQVSFMAVQMGVHRNATPEEGLFCKAALWVRQEEDKLYGELAQFEADEVDTEEGRTL